MVITIIKYFAPFLEVFRKRPVWSEKILPVISMYFIVTLFCQTESIDFVVISQVAVFDTLVLVIFSFVDLRFCLICCMWFFVVYTDLGKCLHTNWDVSPGHVM